METLAIWPAADYNRCCISITESTADIVGYERCGAMAVKTDTEVIIGGRVLTLSGYESEEYLQKVASYINNKLTEYNRVDSRITPSRSSVWRRKCAMQNNGNNDELSHKLYRNFRSSLCGGFYYSDVYGKRRNGIDSESKKKN